MKILNHIFGKKIPTSAAIAAEIEKAHAEHADAVVKRETALAGLSTMSDAEHVKAEVEYQAQRRAADRAEARVAELEKAHADALAIEAEAERQADAERFRQRVNAARNAVEIESAELLGAYDKHAAEIGDILARLREIDAESTEVNKLGRGAPGFESIRSTDAAHRKHPNREASERRAKRWVWVSHDGYVTEAKKNEIGEVIKPLRSFDRVHGYYPAPTLEEREIVIERTAFRPGHCENSLSAIHLPPGFAGGAAHWPRG